jgi:hypothetical protein
MAARGLGIVLSLVCVAAASAARADGTGLLDVAEPGKDVTSEREFYQATRREVAPAEVPAAVARAAAEAVPGFKTDQAVVIRHRPMTSFRVLTEYGLKGHDPAGRAVSVRTAGDGRPPMVTRSAPLKEVPDKTLAEARSFAAKHGYRLTGALVVTRNERFLGRGSVHTTYILKGTSTGRPGAERYVWLGGEGRFWLRDLDDLLVRDLQLD